MATPEVLLGKPSARSRDSCFQPTTKMLLMSNYFLAGVFYMIGSLSFVVGTGFVLIDAIRVAKI
jgi:hypothetical protein